MNFHNTSLKTFAILVLGWVSLFQAQANLLDDASLYIEREKDLKNARTPSDSIKILLDVYNLSDKINRDRVRLQIIDLSHRSDSEEVINSVLRELVTSTDDANDLASLLRISESLPDKEKRQSMQTVIEMEQAKAEAPHVGDSQIELQVAEYARQGFDLTGDPYKEIQNIYRALTYLGASSQGPLYFEYIKRLEELVDQLPEKDHTIRNLFYTTAALFYSRKRDHAKAIHFDKMLIKELDGMDAFYKSKGDNTHNLNYFYYVAYRRLLRNFKGLTPQEVEEYYNKCLQLAAEDEKVAEEFNNGGLTKSYYYMATKQYQKAIPELYKALALTNISKYRRRELLGHLSFALRETGDSKRELEALREYTTLQLEDREERLQDMYREIELRNSVSKLINDEYRAEQNQREENRVMRKTSLTLVYVLAVVLIFLIGGYLRLRNKVRTLEQKNYKLRKNIEYIFDDGAPKGSTNLNRHKNKLKG